MVLLKRKPVHLLPPPTSIPDHAEVFVMRGTDEVFTDYEKYLKRFDWLNQKKFVDAVNGKSGLTYWDALASETKSSAAVESVFPDPLRDPILRKVQFSIISRMDELVNTIYAEFKHDFFPGEEVIVALGDGDQTQYTGIIREKAKFPMIRGADGSIQRAPFSRYFVRLNNTQAEEALLDDKHLRRDRKVFTKQNLRAFLKNSLQREAWTGAPWLVKENLAIQYRLPMEIPAHLLQDARLLHNKQHMLMQGQPPRQKKMTSADYKRVQAEELQMLHMQQQQQHPGAPPQQPHLSYHSQQPQPRIGRPPQPPPIKYPIEDLDVAPKRNGVTRPELKFFTEEMGQYITNKRHTPPTDIEIESTGMLLEVWNTLNVQCEVYVLDSFTFDDFIDAMSFQSLDTTCELFDEVHCAVLSQFVDDKGKIQVKGLPKQVEDTPMDDSEVHDESEVSTPIPDAPARSTRSRLSHMESAADIEMTTEAPNRASEMMADRDWAAQCAARDYADGGWQLIVVGILHQLAASPSFKSRCEKILAHLAPMDEEPTRETARVQYATMDINLRVSALQILTILTIQTDAVKDFLEQCSEDMTDVRKRKIEHQREKKAAMEELAIKDRERKILLPDNMPPSPKPESVEPEATEATLDSIDLNAAGSSDADDDEAPTNGRSLRRGNDRKRKREEDNARREKERAEKAEAAKAQNKQTKEFKKLCNEVEALHQKIRQLEEEIADCDGDLREANVQRTKVLGKDRFCNRYYWFERNGQPFGGLPSSSTAAYGYANGRIWVQGPDPMEREGFIERTKEDQAHYQQRFRMTVPERRKQEEGTTILDNANQWGFYDDPDRLDNLISWLDERGEREKKLRKELCEWRDKIAQYMEAHKKFKGEEAAKKIDVEEEQIARVNTRHKAHEDQTASKERCLRWTNTMALNDMGHLHSEPPKPKKAKPAAREVKGLAVTVTRGAKPMTRQGEKYNFSK
ncbi:Imitation switch two complex protein 1 [Fulvia fulva]|uniref:Imitation switch two complex protein 1 n=1 Tax=Passalora fulva TaxID=5499 RepID=A0A9Q8P8Q3_PASFU|nr:Imitation switch two complex protein 1 [Fulvia fulva]KAK4624005.1 Imitation switch two complex protein 1 [Fulvia fulva]KAK4625334.1 Imitation switch two complex protein 1 [Fulvia fulva]UJO17353.1 Imitation switch two complex protein 1 [Fulvia fulva]WPV15291.1 Imitation switch two complex protein 1 [Fulvia fulva]WPV29512.1 Imitation switch two complex protein 1 [Fulvia fulva]